MEDCFCSLSMRPLWHIYTPGPPVFALQVHQASCSKGLKWRSIDVCPSTPVP